jgi:hypothetical protein
VKKLLIIFSIISLLLTFSCKSQKKDTSENAVFGKYGPIVLTAEDFGMVGKDSMSIDSSYDYKIYYCCKITDSINNGHTVIASYIINSKNESEAQINRIILESSFWKEVKSKANNVIYKQKMDSLLTFGSYSSFIKILDENEKTIGYFFIGLKKNLLIMYSLVTNKIDEKYIIGMLSKKIANANEF